MSEFRKRRRWAIAEWSLAALVVAIVVLNLIAGDVLGFVLATCGACAQSAIAVIAVRHMRSARACLDLREAYPPKRDHLHRDLERLNKLRDNVVSKTGYAPPEDSYVQMPEAVLKARREELERRRGESWYWDSSSGSWKAHQLKSSQKRRRSDDALDRTFVAILEGARDGFLFLAPFLGIVLFGAAIGLIVSLL